jgi:hypothetical protein
MTTEVSLADAVGLEADDGDRRAWRERYLGGATLQPRVRRQTPARRVALSMQLATTTSPARYTPVM